MTHLEEIQKIIEQAQQSGESAFITALKVTNVYERVTDHQVQILSGNICLTQRAGGRGFTSAQILKVLAVSKEQRKRSLKRTPRR